MHGNWKRIFWTGLVFLMGSATVSAETIGLKVAGRYYEVELAQHDAARDFASRLPMTLTFEDFGDTERIAYLTSPLRLGESPMETTPKTGDFAYYVPWGNLAVFVKDFRTSPQLVPLGRFSAEALQAVRQSGEGPVEFFRLTRER